MEGYKTQQRISSSSNIHSQLSFRANRSEQTMTKRTTRKAFEDIQQINQENYDDNKYAVKRIATRREVSVKM